jgi:hypothetical protein
MNGAAWEVEQVALLDLDLHQRLPTLLLVEIPGTKASALGQSEHTQGERERER